MNQLNQLEHAFAEIQGLYDNQQISKEEYLNLLEGLEVEKSVTLNAEELHKKEQLHQYVTTAINVAKMIA
jgi:hypothetical protein